jgi:hypothetical protein
MKNCLQLERSRLLGFRLSQGSDQQVSNDVRIGAKIGKSPTIGIALAPKATKARAHFDARIGAKIGKGTGFRR